MSPHRRKAHQAYSSRDSELSRAVHQSTELAEIATGKSDFLHGIPPSTSFTCSPLSSSVIGSGSSVILAAVVDLAVDDHPTMIKVWFVAQTAISVALFLTNWIDERFRADFHDFELNRERWEVENFPEGEIQEMLHIYTSYGISEDDAKKVAETLAKYPDFWVDHMLLHEIGILPTHMKLLHDHDVDGRLPTVMRSFGSFVASFILPTVVLSFAGSGIYAAVVGLIQTSALLYLKRHDCQWLSNASALSIVSIVLTTALAAYTLLRYGLVLVLK